jgi:hypothetical protein
MAYLPLIFAVLSIIMMMVYLKSGQFFRSLFLTAASGVIALGIVVLVNMIIPLNITFTPFTIGTSALLGIPGVVSMLVVCLL